MKLCDYGCGQLGKYQFKNGKWCCSQSQNSCISIRKKMSISQQTKDNSVYRTQEYRDKISKINFGKKRTLKVRKNLSRIMLKKHSEENSVYKTQEYRDKISKASLENWKDSKFQEKQKNSRTGLKRSDKFKKEQSNRFKGHINARFTIEQWKEKYPTFAKIEEMRYKPGFEKEKIIQVHCKNHNCKNSKEQGGWFTPKNKDQLCGRMIAIETDNYGNAYYYCSDKCKEECPLFNKSVNQLIKQDQIRAGHIENPWYNSQEYQTWRNQVFELDENKCVWCGKEAIVAHHILPQKTHPELSLDPENGISSCKDCHYKYGHRDKWCLTGFLSTLICERIYNIKNSSNKIIE